MGKPALLSEKSGRPAGKIGLPSGLPPGEFSDFLKKIQPFLMPVLAAFLAAFLMPRPAGFSFKFEKNQVWKYTDLVVPADFEVLRPAAEVAEKIETIEAEHGRYFFLDPEVNRFQKKRYSNLVERQAEISSHDQQYADLVANPGAYQSYGQKLLEDIFSKGVSDAPRGPTNPDENTYIIWSNSERKLKAGQLLTLRTAEEMLTDSLPFAPLRQPELILPLLEKCLVPNLFFSDSLTHAGKAKKIANVRRAGFSVKKGEKIIQKGQIVGEEHWLKLNTLAEQNPSKNSILISFGYFLVALLGFGGLFFWQKNFGFLQISRFQNEKLYAVILLGLAAVKLLIWFGDAVPLLLPIFILPMILKKNHDTPTAILTWAILVFLVGFSLDWGVAWLFIQISGAAATMFFFNSDLNLNEKLGASLLVGGVMNLAWLATLISEKLNPALQTGDVPIFLIVSTFIGLVFLPTGLSFLKNLKKNEPTNLPAKK